MTHDQAEVERVAKSLTKGATKACIAMTADWQFAGKATFNANGAHALNWAKGAGGRGAIAEYELREDGKWARPACRLTPLGILIRDHLLREQQGGQG